MTILSWINRKVIRNKEARWNYKFEKGRWDGLKEADELPRFSVIAGYLPFYKPHGHSVLEFGCADGVLYSRLHRELLQFYEGVDVASYTIEKAQQEYGSETARFVAGDMDRYEPSRHYDFIIFNEVLCYSSDFRKLLQRSAGYLNNHGMIITSLNALIREREQYHEFIINSFTMIAGATVATQKNSFDIKVFGK